MTAPVRFRRPVALWMMLLFCLGALPVRGALADSFTIRCDWFDRGNVRIRNAGTCIGPASCVTLPNSRPAREVMRLTRT